MSGAAQILIDSVKEDVLTLIRGEMAVTEFEQRLETRIYRFESETYEYTKEAFIDAIKYSNVEP